MLFALNTTVYFHKPSVYPQNRKSKNKWNPFAASAVLITEDHKQTEGIITMKFKYTSLYAAILTASLGMVGCSSSSSPTAADSSVTGRITGFGSVFVDGVEYETGTATVTKDGVPVSGDADLKVGMIITLKGSASGNTGEAATIEFNDDLEGLVQVNGLASGGSLIVMGQNVSVDANTNFESNDPAITTVEDIPANAVVEVSGYPDGTGNILATYIELKASDVADYGDEMETKGVIADIDTTAQTFMLGNIAVDYSSVSLDFVPANDMFVEVKFNADLTVSKIELEGDGKYGVKGEVGEDLDIEGMITNITATTFELNGQTIQIPDGVDITQYAAGDLVNIEVSVDANGDLVAKKVEEDEANDDGSHFEIEAQVDAVNAAEGTITIDGKTISIDSFNTIMDDNTDAEKYFNIADIVEGDWLDMKVAENADGTFSAVKVERINASDAREKVELSIRIENGVLTTGDQAIDTALGGLSPDAVLQATSLINSFANQGEDFEVKAMLDANGDLQSLMVEVEAAIAVDSAGTVTINGVEVTPEMLPAGVSLDDIAARDGQQVEVKMDLLTGTISAMKSELSGLVAIDATTGEVTVNGTAVTLPAGLTLEDGQNVKLELDAAGNVISMDIEHQSEMDGADSEQDPGSTTPEAGTGV